MKTKDFYSKVGIICTVVFFVLGLLGQEQISLLCKDYSVHATWLIIILLIIILYLICLSFTMYNKSDNKQKTKNNQLRPNYKPSVLVFDDKRKDLKDIDEYLGANCNTVILSDMPHQCLADSFDIIIGDINGIGYGGINSSSILNEIKRNDPYKCVIAITSNLSEARGLDPSIELVPKEEGYLKILLNHVQVFSTNIKNLDKYWSLWLESQQKNKKNKKNSKNQKPKMTRKEINLIKEKFYRHFEDKIE